MLRQAQHERGNFTYQNQCGHVLVGEAMVWAKVAVSFVPCACDYTAEQWEAYLDELWWYNQMEQFEEQYPFPASHTWQAWQAHDPLQRMSMPRFCEQACRICNSKIKDKRLKAAACIICAACAARGYTVLQ